MKIKIALIGTGSRGCSMWGTDLVRNYAEQTEFVGLCDINPGRLQAGKEYQRIL
jgi:predicted dehydrogenase